MTLLEIAYAMFEVLGREPRVAVSGRYRIGDVRHASSDPERLEKVLGFRPMSLFAHGLPEYVAWALENQAEAPDGTAEQQLVAHGSCAGDRPEHNVMRRIAALVPNVLGSSPGQRVRIESWSRPLKKAGWVVEFYPFEDQRLHAVLYQPGRHLAKAVRMLECYRRQLGAFCPRFAVTCCSSTARRLSSVRLCWRDLPHATGSPWCTTWMTPSSSHTAVRRTTGLA